jgi:hypothetical protein
MPKNGKPEARCYFPGRDPSNEVDGRVDLGSEVEEGGEVCLQLRRDARQVADAGRDALADDG